MGRRDERTEKDHSLRSFFEEQPRALAVRRFHLVAKEGPARGASWASGGDRCAVGSHPSNDVVLDDRTVSRFHCEITVDALGPRVRDVGSRNGTIADGLRVGEAWLRDGSLLRLGQSVLAFNWGSEQNAMPLSAKTRFGGLVGASVAMRSAFALLERAAASESTVLLEGETGTGKEEAAQAIHDASVRREHPLIVIDCGALPPALLESELFGHERGAFTGADARRIGAFEAANGGTVLLDEVGELPLDLQPKLLRILERRSVRRVGGNEVLDVDVRVIAATNRNLRSEVNEGRFRPDLYYRIAVLKITLPPLRERPEDIAVLVDAVLDGLGAPPERKEQLSSAELIARLQHATWPGNVRQLRNYLEQCLVLEQPGPVPEIAASGDAHTPPVDPRISYTEARRRALDAFERAYAHALIEHHEGNVSKAARTAGINRPYLHRLLRRHGIRGSSSE